MIQTLLAYTLSLADVCCSWYVTDFVKQIKAKQIVKEIKINAIINSIIYVQLQEKRQINIPSTGFRRHATVIGTK